MATVRTLLMLLGAFSVLLLGAAAPASAATTTQPCHKTVAMSGMSHDAPASPSERPLKNMACCAACITAPALTSPIEAGLDLPHGRPVRLERALPSGLRTSPETGPPKA